MRLLLVEDDRAIGQGIRVALNTEGYTLDWLEDGLSALHALRSEPFDLLLLDLVCRAWTVLTCCASCALKTSPCRC